MHPTPIQYLAQARLAAPPSPVQCTGPRRPQQPKPAAVHTSRARAPGRRHPLGSPSWARAAELVMTPIRQAGPAGLPAAGGRGSCWPPAAPDTPGWNAWHWRQSGPPTTPATHPIAPSSHHEEEIMTGSTGTAPAGTCPQHVPHRVGLSQARLLCQRCAAGRTAAGAGTAVTGASRTGTVSGRNAGSTASCSGTSRRRKQ